MISFILPERFSFVHCEKHSDIFRTEGKKSERTCGLLPEHYTANKVFVSRERIIASWHPGHFSAPERANSVLATASTRKTGHTARPLAITERDARSAALSCPLLQHQ